MVLLTVTESMLSAMKYCSEYQVQGWPLEQLEGEQSLKHANIGQPITHGQVIALSQCLWKRFELHKNEGNGRQPKGITYDLNGLLRGSKVYSEPLKPKKEPTTEFKALMAKLREEEEALAYERMMNPPSQAETFSQRFSASSYAQLFPANLPLKEQDDEITFADINRQMALIINVLVSIIACSVAIWMAASHWSTPKRLGLSMGGSGIVGIAEVVVYVGYLRRVKESKEKEKKKPEVKEIIGTWVINSDKQELKHEKSKALRESKPEANALRKRVFNQNDDT